jgi:hypothetical protein
MPFHPVSRCCFIHHQGAIFVWYLRSVHPLFISSFIHPFTHSFTVSN